MIGYKGLGFKGSGFGLMAKFLVAGMTGGIVSRNAKPLKKASGKLHDLGRYYLLIEPNVPTNLIDELALVSEGVALDHGHGSPYRQWG